MAFLNTIHIRGDEDYIPGRLCILLYASNAILK
jgi:hypothetical protein